MSAIDASGYFPSRAQLAFSAIALPAFVAGTNQLLFELVPTYPALSALLYPWMAFSTAVLSWCAGRYLSPAWLRWLIFGWALVLLDCLTIAACLGRPVERHVGYVLVSSQVGLTVLWAVLANISWQWRMPAVLVASAAMLAYSGVFYWGRQWGASNWDFLMLLTAAVMLILCAAIRLSGFILTNQSLDRLETGDQQRLELRQFGLKHMMIWAAAVVPILLVVRGLNFLVLKRLGGPDLFPLLVVALVVATVNLIAIWCVLGRGYSAVRLAALLLVPYGLATVLAQYLTFILASYTRTMNMGAYTYTRFASSWYDSLLGGIADVEASWPTWLWLNAALLAALLLFLRASGYRLLRKNHNVARASDS